MSPPAGARVRAPRHRHAAGVAVPVGPRRLSGPVHRPAPVAAPPARRTTTAFDHIRALPDHRLLDSLLRSQAWIWLIGLALGGIVAMQVSLLKLNSGIGRAVETASTLERHNAALELSVARLSSGRRIEEAALSSGMVMPPAGEVEYLRVRGATDARWAAVRMRSPSPAAAALLANDGIVPGSLMEPAAGAGAPATAPTATTAPATTAPAATAPATTAPAASGTTAPVVAPATPVPAQPAAPVTAPAASPDG